MNDNNLHRIFANTDCVSFETMQDYLNNKLSEKEKNIVEVHLASCEMCNDEFEGLSLLNNPASLSDTVAELNQKIDDKLKPQGKIINLFKPVYKIAAAVILLIASVWFIKLYVDTGSSSDAMISQTMEESAPKEILSEHHEFATEEVVLEKEEEKTVEEKTNTEKFKNEEIGTGAEGNVSKDVVEIKPEAILEDKADLSVSRAAIEEVTGIDVAEDKAKGESREIYLKEENKLAASEFAEELESEDVDVSNEQQRKKQKADRSNVALSNTVALDNFDLAMAEYNKRDYKEALELFKKSLNNNFNKDEVHFYIANSYWKLEDTGNALINFDKVIAMSESPFYEEALWNKSQILSKQNKEKELINTLNKVIEYKGSYHKKANKMLDSIQDKR